MRRDQNGGAANAACDRFDSELLPRLVAGEPAGPHLDECADCKAALAAHQQLLHATAELYLDATPRPDWKARTMAELARRQSAPPRRHWWAWMVPLGATVALITLVLLRSPANSQIALRNEVRHVAAVRAAGQAAPGDLLIVRASTGGRPAELRVYRDERELVFRCGDGSPCQSERHELRGELTLHSVGRYRPVLVLDPPRTTRPASTTLDDDVQSLRDAGARIELGSPVDVW